MSANNLKIIVLAGYRGAGKDTVADYLVTHFSYEKVAFADVLKDACAKKHRLPRLYFDDRDIKELPLVRYGDKSPRDMCIEYALEKRKVDEDYFTKLVVQTIRDNMDISPHKHHKYVISDWRYHNEVDYIRATFPCVDIVTWYIHRFEAPPSNHESETQLSPEIDCDFIIDNRGDVDFMMTQVNKTLLKSP